MSNLKTVSPPRAAELVRDGAVLIDIRETDEHARERVIMRSAASMPATRRAPATTY